MMTKDTILHLINFELEVGMPDPSWSTEEITNAMVAAYNRAIEDAIGLSETYNVVQLEQLKIKV